MSNLISLTLITERRSNRPKLDDINNILMKRYHTYK